MTKQRERSGASSVASADSAEGLLELIMPRYGRASTLVTPNSPVEDWGKSYWVMPPWSALCSTASFAADTC
ncbi:MAG: hypothetical protein WB763_05920 [Terriglobia bacterium]